MSNYTKSTNFAAKDSLASGNPAKIVKGTEIDVEFNAIETAVATKADTTTVNTSLALKANLASPALTGTPTAPNAALGTRGTQIATMESFATEFAKSLAANGYVTLPGGLIIQWGVVSVTSGIANTAGSAAVTFPIAFPTSALWVSTYHNSADAAYVNSSASTITTTGFSAGLISSAASLTRSVEWIAIGY